MNLIRKKKKKKKKKKIEVEKNNDKYGKVLYKLMDNTVYGKTMKNVSNVTTSLWWEDWVTFYFRDSLSREWCSFLIQELL